MCAFCGGAVAGFLVGGLHLSGAVLALVNWQNDDVEDAACRELGIGRNGVGAGRRTGRCA
jgi:hypothetical protein